MKKAITLVALLSIATVTLTGCSWFQSSQDVEKEPTVTVTDTTSTDTEPAMEPTDTEPKDITPPEPVPISDVLTPKATDKSFKDLKKASFSLGNETGGNPVTITDDTMTVKVGYTGCDVSEFVAYWPASFMESYPVQATILLVRNEDIPEGAIECDMYLNGEVKIGLATVKQHYENLYRSETGTMILSVSNGDNLSKGITYDF